MNPKQGWCFPVGSRVHRRRVYVFRGIFWQRPFGDGSEGWIVSPMLTWPPYWLTFLAALLRIGGRPLRVL